MNDRHAPLLLPMLWRRRGLLLVAVAISALLVGGGSFLLPTRYTSSTTILVSSPEEGDGSTTVVRPIEDPERYLSNLATAMLSDDTLSDVLSEEGLLSEEGEGRTALPTEELRRQLSVTPRPDADLLIVTAEAATPQRAQRLASTLVTTYERQVSDQVLQRAERTAGQLRAAQGQVADRLAVIDGQLEQSSTSALRAEQEVLLEQLSGLRTREEQVAVSAALFGSGLQTIEAADLPVSPSQPAPVPAAALGGSLGLLFAAAAVFLVDVSGLTAPVGDLATRLGVPVLGRFGDRRRRRASRNDRYRDLAAEEVTGAAMLACQPLEVGVPRLIAVVGHPASAGRSMLAGGLAARFAAEGVRTVVVDADAKHATLTTELRLQGRPGLRDAVRERDGAVALAHALPLSRLCGARLVPVGTAGDVALPANAGTLRSLFLQLGKDADAVVIDAPLMGSGAVVAQAADVVVLVTDRSTAGRRGDPLARTLDLVQTPIAGVVASRTPKREG